MATKSFIEPNGNKCIQLETIVLFLLSRDCRARQKQGESLN